MDTRYRKVPGVEAAGCVDTSRARKSARTHKTHRGMDLVIDTLDEFAGSWASNSFVCVSDYVLDAAR